MRPNPLETAQNPLETAQKKCSKATMKILERYVKSDQNLKGSELVVAIHKCFIKKSIMNKLPKIHRCYVSLSKADLGLLQHPRWSTL